ncbi:MAG TPA: DUF3291 domain-containing protein [Candidatus Nanopelagicales bacterium]|nr:DUF3291 domain-containing protein [Candidatus Nanopelagicales bacterium]
MARLAQLNVARLRHELDHPDLAPFVEALDAVNAVADDAPGFVWRLQSDDGNATSIRPWGDDVIVNLSVWEDLAALHAYVYGEAHAAVLKQRRMFFTRMETPSLVLWWVEDGHSPSLEEAHERLLRLEADGPTPGGFTMRTAFTADGTPHV